MGDLVSPYKQRFKNFFPPLNVMRDIYFQCRNYFPPVFPCKIFFPLDQCAGYFFSEIMHP